MPRATARTPRRKGRRNQAAPDCIELADLFRALSDPTRLRILQLLSDQSTCVCDAAEELDLSVATVSHHLRLLRSAGIVRDRRDGRRVYYSLADGHVAALLTVAVDHVGHP